MKIIDVYGIDEIMSDHFGLCEDMCIELLRLSLAIANIIGCARGDWCNLDKFPFGRCWTHQANDSVLNFCDLCDMLGTARG